MPNYDQLIEDAMFLNQHGLERTYDSIRDSFGNEPENTLEYLHYVLGVSYILISEDGWLTDKKLLKMIDRFVFCDEIPSSFVSKLEEAVGDALLPI